MINIYAAHFRMLANEPTSGSDTNASESWLSSGPLRTWRSRWFGYSFNLSTPLLRNSDIDSLPFLGRTSVRSTLRLSNRNMATSCDISRILGKNVTNMPMITSYMMPKLQYVGNNVVGLGVTYTSVGPMQCMNSTCKF